jgi:alanine-glyoxylate transaminase/serine-glyoxylate transaminase/serine-pyruvate transaminase
VLEASGQQGPSLHDEAGGEIVASVRGGREFIHLPGPTNIPDRVLNAMHRPACDFAAPAFLDLALSCLTDLKSVFQTRGDVYAFSANGHGAWEVALANLLRPGDRILVPDTGRFALSWAEMAQALGLEVVLVASDLRHPIEPGRILAELERDRERRIRAVLGVQVETSTGMAHDIAALRSALDETAHPALLIVDAIASLACIDLPMDELGIDVVLAASQKGLMLPPGLAFVAVGARADAMAREGGAARKYWDWRTRRGGETYLWFYGTPPTQMIAGLRTALDMLLEEGLRNVFARHHLLAGAVRAAVGRWSEAGGLEFQTVPQAARSDTVTAIRMPAHDPDGLRVFCRDRLSVAFGGGLGRLQGEILRIGHLGDLNSPMILGALAALEVAMQARGVPFAPGGVTAAVAHIAGAMGGFER